MALETNVIYCGDNLEVLKKSIPDESIDLIYIDPPFNTSRQYEVFWGEAQERRAFEDRFGDVMTYLEWMRPRIKELHRVLKLNGSLYYHCDWHATHYIKLELDRLFGFDNFQNEIIWRRTTSHGDSKQGAKHYGRIHDTLLFYTKTDKYTWNTQFIEFSESQIRQQYNKQDADGRRYRLVTPTAKKPGGDTSYEWKGVIPPSGRFWAYTKEKMAEMDAKGLLYYSNTGQPYIKYYLDERPGVAAQSLWMDISPMSPTSKERLGYPTQKPIALLERIIGASSNEGQVVLDAFCGCGTTLEAAAKLKRKWIGIDFSPTACRVMAERLESRLGLVEGKDFVLKDMPKTADELRRMPPFEFQNWAVVALGGIPNKVKVGDYGIDGRLYLADIAKQDKSEMRVSDTVAQGMFETLDKWYPIQVKQQDKAGRPDIDAFETAMRRDKRKKGYFIAFGFSSDAVKEIKRAQNDGIDIAPITVDELLGFERTAISK